MTARASAIDEDIMSSPFNLERWEPRFRRGEHKAIIVIGARNTGKSFFLRALYKKSMKDLFDIRMVFSNTASDGFFEGFLDTRLVYREFEPTIIQTLQQQQEDLVKADKRPLDVLIIFDDCSSRRQTFVDEISQLFIRGRHLPLNATVVFMTQDHKFAAPEWRSNADLAIIFRQHGARAIDMVCESFVEGSIDAETLKTSGFTRKVFCQELLRQYTNNHGCLVVDFMVPEMKRLTDSVFYYKA
jgi:hypothetical protein